MEEVITQEQIVQILTATADETIERFNGEYGTEAETNDDIEEYIIAFSIVSLFGYLALRKRKDISSPIKKLVLSKFDRTYKGIRETTRKEIDQLRKRLGREPLAQEINAFRAKRVGEISNGLVNTGYNEISELVAMQEGFGWVGAVNTPPRVRESHQKHDGKFWRVGSYNPQSDYNCKCRYTYFKTAKEARQAGFKPL